MPDSVNLSATDDVSDRHRTPSSITKQSAEGQSRQRGEKSGKRKRKHCQYDVFDKQKPCKYRNVERDGSITPSVTVIGSVYEEHHCENSSEIITSSQILPELMSFTDTLHSTVDSQQEKRKKKRRKKKLCESAANSCETTHDSEKKLTKLMMPFTGTLQSTVDSQQEKRKKKKRKKKSSESAVNSGEATHEADCKKSSKCSKKQKLPELMSFTDTLQSADDSQQEKRKKKQRKKKSFESAMNSGEATHETDCKQSPKCGKKKKFKKRGHTKDIVPHNDLSEAYPQQSSSHLLVSTINVVNGRDTTTNPSDDGEVLLVSELADANPDEARNVERMYKEHKSSKSKHKRQKVNTGVETKIADSSPSVALEASDSQKHRQSSRNKSTPEKHGYTNHEAMNLLHAKNTLYHLRHTIDVKNAGQIITNISCFC